MILEISIAKLVSYSVTPKLCRTEFFLIQISKHGNNCTLNLRRTSKDSILSQSTPS